MNRYCLALDLVDDPLLIKEYEAHHRAVWPEIQERIKAAGIINMEIYRVENRLFMIMETNDHFSFDQKAKMDESSPLVQKWEKLMWNYQQALPGSKPDEKWRLMNLIYKLN